VEQPSILLGKSWGAFRSWAPQLFLRSATWHLTASQLGDITLAVLDCVFRQVEDQPRSDRQGDGSRSWWELKQLVLELDPGAWCVALGCQWRDEAQSKVVGR